MGRNRAGARCRAAICCGLVSVRAYYERNTRLFLTLGVGRQARSIHRAIWAAGVASSTDALRYVNRMVLHQAHELAVFNQASPLRVLDLGCGVGETLLHLAEHLTEPSFGLGLSISPLQVRLARQAARARHLDMRCTFVEADYSAVPAGASFNLAVAIESLAHAPDLGRVIHQAAGALRVGGRLAVCDDVLASGRPGNATEARWVEAFRAGWHAPGLAPLPEVIALAHQAGLRLIEQRDLTNDLRVLPVSERVMDITLLLGRLLPRRHMFVHSMLGGVALQHCLRRGIIRYMWLVFEKFGV